MVWIFGIFRLFWKFWIFWIFFIFWKFWIILNILKDFVKSYIRTSMVWIFRIFWNILNILNILKYFVKSYIRTSTARLSSWLLWMGLTSTMEWSGLIIISILWGDDQLIIWSLFQFHKWMFDWSCRYHSYILPALACCLFFSHRSSDVNYHQGWIWFCTSQTLLHLCPFQEIICTSVFSKK